MYISLSLSHTHTHTQTHTHTHPNTHLPLGVVVLLQRALVGTGEHSEPAVLAGHALHGGPGAHDAVGWTEREVVQILVHGVAGRLITFAKTKGSQQRAQCYALKPMCVCVCAGDRKSGE